MPHELYMMWYRSRKPSFDIVMAMKIINQIGRVHEYYKRDWELYKQGWGSEHNLAMHFGYFDKQAHDHESSVDNLNKKLSEIVGIKKNDKVVDAGSGVGSGAIWLSKNIGCHVTAVNIINWQQDIAKQQAQKNGVADNIHFVVADYAFTGLPADSYTVFWAVESAVHASDKNQLFSEAYRLLKSGGKIMICEGLITDVLMNKSQEALLQAIKSGWAVPSFIKISQQETLLKKAGFTKIKSIDISPNIGPSVDKLRTIANQATDFKENLKKLHKDNGFIMNHQDTIYATVASYDQGLWRYTITTGVKK